MPRPGRPPPPPQVLSEITDCIRRSCAYQPQNEPRVIHDLVQCYTQYPTLPPIVCTFKPIKDSPSRLVALRGTIPITYKGSPYKIPVHIWVMPNHPNTTPVVYVVPTRIMVLHRHHPYVNYENGFVSVPYLTNWDPLTSTLQACVQRLIHAFSHKVPVYSQSTNTTVSPQELHRQSLITSLSSRMTDSFELSRQNAARTIKVLSGNTTTPAPSSDSRSSLNSPNSMHHINLSNVHQELKAAEITLSKWVLLHPEPPPNISIDHLTIPRTMLNKQSIESVAIDAALTEALDQLDEAIDKGIIDAETYVREVRRISRRQFFERAMQRKLQPHLASIDRKTEDSPICTASRCIRRKAHASY